MRFPSAPAFLKSFFRMEAASGIILFFAAVLAIIAANSPLHDAYHHLLNSRMGLSIGSVALSLTVEQWINDAVMAVFFFLIGMEMKREMVEGELASVGQAMLPAVAAAGGVMLPAVIYSYCNWGNDTAMRGWAIPSATDIAFSLAVLSLFGSRVPFALKVFLMAIAVIDDLIAIIIIAFFYTDTLHLLMLNAAMLMFAILLALNSFNVRTLLPYLLFGVLLWYFVLESGVHATIAGVMLGFSIPIRLSNKKGESVLRHAIHVLHPWVAYGIMPVFAFANAGISFAGLSFSSLLEPVPLGIMLGLFIGKQVGIFSFTWLMVKTKLAKKPAGASWGQIYAVAIIAGIGFTMSLFIGGLAFKGHESLMVGKTLGVLAGSALSAIVGYILLALSTRRASS